MISDDYSYLEAKDEIECRSDRKFNLLNLKIENYSQEIRICPNVENSEK